MRMVIVSSLLLISGLIKGNKEEKSETFGLKLVKYARLMGETNCVAENAFRNCAF